ncbi:MAG: hypothetical protein EBS38_03910 [Actinobacteria bacterium]|nr:hypothetical protein [Actinomycetota bacterium]
MSKQLSSAAQFKLEQLIRRLFSLTIALASIETFANAIDQIPQLNTFGLTAIWLLFINVIFIVLGTWTTVGPDSFIRIYGLLAFVYLLLWPLMVRDPNSLSQDFQPWIWWAIGMGVVAMGVVAPAWLSLVYLFLSTLSWYILNTSVYGGLADPLVTLQDSTYIFLFGGTILGLFMLVRDSVAKVDLANSAVIQAAVTQASIDATERERQRIDALVHDKVLNTLLLAANAKSKSEQQSAAKLANEAIVSLNRAQQESEESSNVSQLGLFRALARVAEQMNPAISVEIEGAGAELLPKQVAQAITEAAIQAIDNADRHSQAKAITLRLQALEPSGVRIVLHDDGLGFRLDRIPRDRIGVRTSIFARLESVQGKAKIVSTPGSGTTVSLEWKP